MQQKAACGRSERHGGEIDAVVDDRIHTDTGCLPLRRVRPRYRHESSAGRATSCRDDRPIIGRQVQRVHHPPSTAAEQVEGGSVVGVCVDHIDLLVVRIQPRTDRGEGARLSGVIGPALRGSTEVRWM